MESYSVIYLRKFGYPVISIHPRTVVSHTTDVRLSTSPCPSTTQGNVKAYNLFQACVEAYNLV